MNKKLKAVLIVAALSVTTLNAADSIIGTEADPIVTKSYVDQQIAKVSSTGSSSQLSNLEARLSAQEDLISKLSQELSNLQEAGSSSFEIVKVPAGSSIYGKQGSEMIIRSGQGSIIASAAGGVQDVTDGVDLAGGMKAPNNNMLIVPREDGRGIMANKDMVVMVRGGYIIL